MKPNSLRLKLGASLERQSKKTQQRLWSAVSNGVMGSRRSRAAVNVGEISRNSKTGSKVVVTGKVLGAGSIDHKVTVVAYSFTEGARAKITSSGGECVFISDFMKSSRDVKDVLILG